MIIMSRNECSRSHTRIVHPTILSAIVNAIASFNPDFRPIALLYLKMRKSKPEPLIAMSTENTTIKGS
jgi:hypothetical protein